MSTGLYHTFIGRFVDKWYLAPLADQLATLTPEQRRSVQQQAIIGWLQTILLIIVVIQSAFAGVLRALPPDIRAGLGFLHRIEWGAYAGILLILWQVVAGWSQRVVLTNRWRLLAWLLSRPRVLIGDSARRTQIAYIVVAILMVGAVLWVRAHGFIVTPAN